MKQRPRPTRSRARRGDLVILRYDDRVTHELLQEVGEHCSTLQRRTGVRFAIVVGADVHVATGRPCRP